MLSAGLLGAGTVYSQDAAKGSDETDPYCSVTGPALGYMAVGTRKMAGLMEKIAASSNPRANPYLNRQRAELRRMELASTTEMPRAAYIRADMAYELLNAGDTLASIDEFAKVDQAVRSNPGMFGAAFEAQIHHYEALAHLRLGELENCITNHNSASCILPIQPAGFHKLQRGSRRAIEILEAQLGKAPRDRKGAWLLNIAYMTLGEYPQKVPVNGLIPEIVFKSDYDIKHFDEVAGNVGLDVQGHAGGSVTEDFDGDGDLDVLTSDWGMSGPMHYFRSNGDGTFTDRTMEAGLTGLAGGLNMIQGDFNNDGLPDVLVMRGAWMGEAGEHPDSLLRNDGNGHFSDVTEEAGLLAFAPNQAAVWLDFDGDGWLDIYFGYESSGQNIHPCKLYRNNRNGTFTECGAAAGVAAKGFVKGVASADFNNDGRPDLYLSRLGQPNLLFRNDGPAGGKDATGGPRWKFTEVGEQAGVTEPLASFPAWFFDYNNDGWADIFVAGYRVKNVGDVAADYLQMNHTAERMRLFRNNKDGTFKDVTKEANLYRLAAAMGANYGDFDNDGWLDMYLGTGDPDLSSLMPNRAFRNAGGEKFQDVTTSGGFGQLQKGHGVSFADLDNDGDQDIYHDLGGAYEGDFYRNALFENPGHGNHSITLKLEGVKSNRAALGARITVVVDENGAERSIYRTVGTGGSFGANPLRQEIGIGKAVAVRRVEVQWPASGASQIYSDLKADAFYKIREGSAQAELQAPSRFQFAKGAAVKPHHAHDSLKQAK